jgi:hypothetical protein
MRLGEVFWFSSYPGFMPCFFYGEMFFLGLEEEECFTWLMS